MPDDFPSLEMAATAVALSLVLRAFQLWRRNPEPRPDPARVESARARDLVGFVILASALLYGIRVERTGIWFLLAGSVALLAHLAAFLMRARRGVAMSDKPQTEAGRDEADGDDNGDDSCTVCGGDARIELSEPERFVPGLTALGSVWLVVCPTCGSVRGEVEDPRRIPLGPEHGTELVGGKPSDGLQDAEEHDG